MVRGAGITEWPVVRGQFLLRMNFPAGRQACLLETAIQCLLTPPVGCQSPAIHWHLPQVTRQPPVLRLRGCDSSTTPLQGLCLWACTSRHGVWTRVMGQTVTHQCTGSQPDTRDTAGGGAQHPFQRERSMIQNVQHPLPNQCRMGRNLQQPIASQRCGWRCTAPRK